MPMGLWVVALALAGCRSPHPTVREECGITERVPYGWAEKLTDRCIARLADDVGLDWASFGVQASDMRQNGSSPAAMVLSGLYTLAASDSAASSLSLPPTPLSVQNEFLVQSKADPSEFWYSMVVRRVDHVVFRPDVPPQERVASYDAARLEVSVADLTRLPDFNPSAPAPLPPVSMAATLIHEAAHAFAARHSPGSESIDLNNNGANSVEATWLYGWIVANGDKVSAVDRDAACWSFAGVCRRILLESFPCDTLAVTCAAAGLPDASRP
jgi:hypothetical protein